MKWSRSDIPRGAWLALLALVVQFALMFGGDGVAQAAPIPQASATQADGRAALAIDRKTAGRQLPRDKDQLVHGRCVVCAVAAMASTALFAPPPVLLLPQAIEILNQTTEAEFAHLKSAGAASRPHAPPAS